MDTYEVTLKPRGSWVGELHSDTLFGATCWALATLNITDVGKMLADFDQHPRFTFSSAFPLLHQGERRLRFYPMPFLPPLHAEQVRELSACLVSSSVSVKQALVKAVELSRQLDDAQFISESLFGEIVTGKVDRAGLWQRLADPQTPARQMIELSSGMILTATERREFSDDPLKIPFAQATVQRNQIERVRGGTVEGMLFYEQQTFARAGVALWMLVRTDALEWIRSAMRYLGDSGLGGRRSTGRGHFDIQIEGKIAVPSAGTDSNSFVSLSRYLPIPGEWDEQKRPLYYRIDNVRAKHESAHPLEDTTLKSAPVYKQMVRLFQPGSIFPTAARKEVYGKLAQVGDLPGRTVWLSGMSVSVPARIGGEHA